MNGFEKAKDDSSLDPQGRTDSEESKESSNPKSTGRSKQQPIRTKEDIDRENEKNMSEEQRRWLASGQARPRHH